jgi:CheY-like chemotaxis protein
MAAHSLESRKILRASLRSGTGGGNRLVGDSSGWSGMASWELDVDYPDVIICDLHMDEMDGMQFCNNVRNDKNLRNHGVPIVMLTGDLDKLLHEVSRQVGAMSVLTKPVSAEELGHHIEKAVGYAFA